ncbi:MAG: cyclic nucleotide-binding domain-containing protein [Alcanivoracaceae bacterium]|nr:cyclic nucleotide-binding domain-containing protein [Alcanivoracaceae bacterium]
MKLSQPHLWLNPFKRETLDTQVLKAWRATPLLQGIRAGVCEKLVERTHVRQYQPGEYVFREGDSAVAAALIVQGNVVIRSDDNDIARLGAGEFFGEAALLEDTPRSASAVAEGVTLVSLLVRYQLEEFVQHRPQAGLNIMTNLAHLLLARLHRGNNDHTEEKNANDGNAAS